MKTRCRKKVSQIFRSTEKKCEKNPGHQEFIPIELFRLKHLPKGLKDTELYAYIIAVADLTVKLSVNMTSPERAEFWPNTTIPYFLSGLKGKKTLRTGSGIVRCVVKYTDTIKHWKYGLTTCLCYKCKASDKPSKIWWEIKVWTAAHVIIDDIEASHTALRFFYDREDSELVILKDEVCLDFVTIERDVSGLSYITCDEKLGNKLKKMESRFDHISKKVLAKYSDCWHSKKFNFIVSHPHGCNKQVSIDLFMLTSI